MRFVSGDEIHRVLTFPTVVAAMEVGHRRPRMTIRDLVMGEERAHYFVRSAVLDGTDHLVEDGRRLGPRSQAPRARRSAHPGRGRRRDHGAVAGARAPIRPPLAPPSARLEPDARARRRSGRSTARREHAAEATTDLAEAVRQGEVITSVTRAHTPLIQGSWLQPGVHLDLVGGYTAETREADDVAVRRARIFVDRLESALDVGDIRQPIASGAIGQEDILGDLYDLVGGVVPGRLGSGDITLFKNAGGGHLDLMTAQAIMSQLEAS